MNGFRSFAFALFCCAAGCGGTASTDPGATYMLTYVRSGGSLGSDDEIDVDVAAKVIARRSKAGAAPVTAKLADTELSAVTAAVTAADIQDHPGPYKCSPCGDQLQNEATLVTGDATYTAGWEDSSSAPQAMIDLGTSLLALAAKKLPQP